MTAAPLDPALNRDAEDIAYKVQKLTKINAALIHRVETAMDQQANAFSMFQTAIGLEAQVRHRTEELNNVLSRLEGMNAELSHARDEAERANRFMTRFFTAVGHDLLQPLHAARLTLSELNDVQKTPDALRLSSNISSALTTIEELLTSILDISKLDAGAFVPKIQAVALGDMFQQLALATEPMARRKNLELRWRPTGLAVHSDPLMLRRILQSLIANAVRYTDRGGLLLAARKRNNSVSIEVWDTGPGIAIAERERIFEEFQRGMASERTGGAGFGLGLSIVKRMSEALNHTLDFHSRPGRGTSFAITAPIADRPLTPQPGTREIEPPLAASLVGQPLVVIDNDLAVLEAMQTLLTRWGAVVRLARDLDDISEIMADKTFHPAMVLADYQLDDGVLGLEAVLRVRHSVSSKIPAIVITADRTEATATAVARAGCEILYKPVRPAELRSLMQHLLKRPTNET